jgi:hypothetical protein
VLPQQLPAGGILPCRRQLFGWASRRVADKLRSMEQSRALTITNAAGLKRPCEGRGGFVRILLLFNISLIALYIFMILHAGVVLL